MSDRSVGVLQEADEERARRKDNPDDWPQIKARLEYESTIAVSNQPISKQHRSDIRAALQRIEELEQQLRLCVMDSANEEARANDAEAKLARVVEELTHAFDQHGCFCGSDDNADWTYGKKWVHHACCPVGVAIDMARGGE